MKVLVAHPDANVRFSLGRFLRSIPGIDVICFASTANDAVRKALNNRPVLIVMAWEFEFGVSGFEALVNLLREWPEAKVIMCGRDMEDPGAAQEAIRFGAAAALPLNLTGPGVTELIQKILR